ncbi:MAG: Outer membrane protein alpha precursor [bacterium ADurb.Bin236]|nr:MAG: Outer membrane protein alpha precursor [bacterium ADurb.Bin236]HOY63709.1 S-layer homology domain-containing protein [bacterium]
MKKLVLAALALTLTVGISVKSYSATLVDVHSGHWAADAVQKLVDSGLIEGYPDGTFKGDRPLTRYEYAMVIARMMDILDKTYCLKSECKAAPAAPGAPSAPGISPAQLDEIRDIVKKLAAEFKDELAALKVKVDENSSRIDKLEKKVDNAFLGKLQVGGSVRQRIDAPGTDLADATFVSTYNSLYGTAIANGDLNAGYEMLANLTFDGEAGKNVTFSLGLQKTLLNRATIGENSTAPQDDDLKLVHAFVDLNFSNDVAELDVLKLRSGYQDLAFGPYGMMVDTTGADSMAAMKLDVAKSVVALTGFAGALDMDQLGVGMPEGLGGGERDLYAAARLGLDLPFVDLGVNYLASGFDKEKAWGVDMVAPLLKDSMFLKELRGEYMKVVDLTTGASPAAGDTDYSFVVGLDLYKSKKAGISVTYGDIPAVTGLTSAVSNPFTEYDTVCPRGLDVSAANCISYNSGNLILPAGFEGFGVEGTYTVLGDVELGGKAVMGNYAGGALGAIDLDGKKYPGFGAVSVTKPINKDSQFKVEYMQQGASDYILNRVRGELLINF